MSACVLHETGLTEKHEKILGRRAELLQQMEGSGEQLCRRRQVEECEAARRRNSTLVQDLQRIEDRLRGTWLPHPHLLALETRYWASVEESLPDWERFFLGKGPPPAPGTGQPPRKTRLPPRPQPRTGRLER
ncbi:centrosomal protein 15 kDa isoform X3 [Pungitius pungitius]|uniref:centrosomal protein 15 kDa isoform X3 n=1 Tax=Pungitius pungitius TaxID=134920 RepID=UPI002E128A2E